MTQRIDDQVFLAALSIENRSVPAELCSDLLRRIWRAALQPASLLSLEEAIDALPCPDPDARIWLIEQVPSTAEIAGVRIYRWGSVLGALPAEPYQAPAGPTTVSGEQEEPDGSDMVTAEKLAEVLGVPVGTVHRWTSEKRIPFYKFAHKTVRYRISDVLSSAAQTTAAEGDHSNGRVQKRRKMAGRLPIPGSSERRVETIPPHDWSRDLKKGGRGS